MKKTMLSLALVLSATMAFAQDEAKNETPKDDAPKKAWTRDGNISLLFSQAAFNKEWVGVSGGVNSYSGNLNINYNFNYAKGDWTWNNKFIAEYGLSKLGELDIVKNNDRLELNSIAGKKAKGNWYYSLFFNFKTQMDVGLQDGIVNSHFFSPAFFQFGPGMLWKKSDNLFVNISPAAGKVVIVHDEFTEFGPSFGVEQGDTSRFELGASLSAYYKLNIMKNISMENTLNLYSNYLEDPQNVDVDYTVNFVMTVNKYVSANLTFQTIYDDNAIAAVRVREAFGVGFNYGF